MADPEIVFHHSPQTRSGGVFVLLEELGAPYTLNLLNMKAGEQRGAGYLKINPMGKVPAISHGDAVVTEQVAVYLYLADLFPQAGLAPAIGDPLRGPYLRWIAFYGSSFEPALVDKSQQHVTPPAMAPYGDYDTTIKTLNDQLARGPWILGERYTAADVLWGTALGWTVKFALVPNSPEVERYLARFDARPAVIRAREKDAELAKRFA